MVWCSVPSTPSVTSHVIIHLMMEHDHIGMILEFEHDSCPYAVV